MDVFQQQRDYEISSGVSIRQLQMKLLDIFSYLKKICEENNLTYWCGGGTMLGAVRHHGFIPWDDDLDVFLPRKDYEKLYSIWNDVADTKHYVLVRTDRNHNYHHTAMNLVDIQSTYINKHSENEDLYHGCYIDVIPFEGCPKTKLGRIAQIYHSIIFSVFNVQRLPDNQGPYLRIPTIIMFTLIKNQEKRYKIWVKHQLSMSKNDFYTSKYVKETITSFKGLFRLYDRKDFDTVDASFEGLSVKIPSGYDTYMNRIYGDYMAIPQNIDMSTRYGVIKYINLNEPYTKFRGTYYLTQE